MRWKVLSYLAAALVALCHTLPVCAQDPRPAFSVSGVTQDDLDGDGIPDLAVIDCAFASERDRVMVYDRGNDMRSSQRWQEATDFANDAWVFDVGADGVANLVVLFDVQGAGAQLARVYHDVTGDGHVSYTLDGSRITITESMWPALEIRARTGGWDTSGQATFDLDIAVDGDIYTIFGSDATYLRLFSLDGVVDATVHIWDLDQDGLPDYDFRQAYPPVPDSYNYIRSNVMVAKRPFPWPLEGTIFWPYLGNLVGMVRPYVHFPAPIQVDWAKSRVALVAEFVPSRGGDSQVFIYTLNTLDVEEPVAYANFENPFAFYDLSQTHDGYPDLQIRLQYNGPYDVNFAVPSFDQATEHVRYSWDQDHDHTWDYALQLVGRHPITDSVALPDVTIRTIPYDVLPDWVLSRDWDAVAFVQVERKNPPYWTSEGIYEWGIPEDVRAYYITGQYEELWPDLDYSELGFRGEYNYEYVGRPQLYLSAVDRKLHLYRAKRGNWALDSQRRVDYRDRDGDGFIDEWSLSSTGRETPDRRLSHVVDHLVYSGDGKVILARTDVSPVLFWVSPPTTRTEWAMLGGRLDEAASSAEPTDFAAMIAPFAGTATEIEHASVTDVHATEGGFHLVLDLGPGFHISPDPLGWQHSIVHPGRYVVLYDGVGLRIRHPTSFALTVPDLQFCSAEGPLRELGWASVEAVIENEGMEEVHDLQLQAALDGPGGQREVLTTTLALLPSEGSQQVSWDWVPTAPGIWQVRIEVGPDAAGSGLQPGQVLAEAQVEVQPRVPPSPQWRLSLGGRVRPRVIVLFAAVPAVLACAAAGWALHAGDDPRRFGRGR